jgi:exopolysaccharide biosynthesis WecB/TagA/CpsF family protein
MTCGDPVLKIPRMVYKRKEAIETNGLALTCNTMVNSDKSINCETEHALPLTVEFSDCNLPNFIQIAADFGSETYGYTVTPNVDHLIRFCDDPSFRDLYRTAQFVLLDSRFLAYLLRLSAGLRLHTSPGSDVTAQLFEKVIAPDDKIVLVGGTQEQARILSSRFGLRNLRHMNPPMGFIHDPAQVEACVRFIEAESPFRFCLLAVGCPQQELLARALQTRGRARGLALCVGASINFLTGIERRAPKWMQNAGFEWFYRLLRDPGRLARRYLIRGPRIFFLLPRLKFELRPVAPLTPKIIRS